MEKLVCNPFRVALWDNADVGGGPGPLGAATTTRRNAAMLSDLLLEEFRGAVEWKNWFATRFVWLCGTMPTWEVGQAHWALQRPLVAMRPCYQICYLKSFEGQWNGKTGLQPVSCGFVGQCRRGRWARPTGRCNDHSWQCGHAIR